MLATRIHLVSIVKTVNSHAYAKNNVVPCVRFAKYQGNVVFMCVLIIKQQNVKSSQNHHMFVMAAVRKRIVSCLESFIHQNIKLRLSTEINTVRENWAMGCDLHTIMHSNLPDKRLMATIEKMIKDSISDLLPKATVSVSLLNTNYLDYHDSIKVVIINDEDVYYFVI